MTTPRSVHSIGCATYMRSKSSRNPIVAKMKQKTREYRAGPGPRKRKDDSNKSKQCDQAPGPAKLRAVHEPEQDSGHDDSNEGAEANGAKRGGARRLRESGKLAGKKRVKIAAENGFFN